MGDANIKVQCDRIIIARMFYLSRGLGEILRVFQIFLVIATTFIFPFTVNSDVRNKKVRSKSNPP